MSETLSLLTRTKDTKENYFFFDYATLDIRHLGSVYENLLEHHLVIKNKKVEEKLDVNTKERKLVGVTILQNMLLMILHKDASAH